MLQIGLLSTEQPASALILALAPALAASGVSVAAAVDDFLPFDTDRREQGGLMMIRGAGASAADRLPPGRVFWIGEPPFIRAAPVGRTLGRARFHEAVGLLTGKARGGLLEKSVIETGAYILAGLGEFDAAAAAPAMAGALDSGTAGERFALIFGEAALADPGALAPLADQHLDVIAERRGVVSGWSAPGLTAALDKLGPKGGIGRIAAAGQGTSPQKPVARLYGRNSDDLAAAQKDVLAALKLGKTRP